MSLSAASAVTPAGDGRFAVTVSPDWCIGGKPNGGYLLGVLARATSAVLTDHPDPLAISAHYLSAPASEAAEVEVEVLRHGRTASQARARLVQDGRACVEALLTTGTLADDTEPVFDAHRPPPVPAFEDCTRIGGEGPGGIRLTAMESADVRIDPMQLGFAVGRPGGSSVLTGWLALPDEPFDPLSLLYAIDAFPPATLDLGSSGWVPTLELTAYVRARPAAGPVQVEQRAGAIEDGRVDEACRVWDSRGRLVAQATQLAGVRLA